MTQGTRGLIIGVVSTVTGLLVAVPTGLEAGTSTSLEYGLGFQFTVGFAAGLGAWILTTLCVAVLLYKLGK